MKHILYFVLVCGLLSVLPPLAQAQIAGHLLAADLVKVCHSDDDLALCDAYLRAVPERLAAMENYIGKACNKNTFDAKYIDRFRQYTQKHPAAADMDASLYALGYWTQAGIPCQDNVPFKTVQQLQMQCASDNSGGSPCKFYITSLLELVKLQAALAKVPFVCVPPGEAGSTVDDAKIRSIYTKWVDSHPAFLKAPAALGFVDALVSAYPCAKP